MFSYFLLAIAFTIGISALCSILEAMILSTTTTEIESLKRSHPLRGKRLEDFKQNIEETSSAILSLNTIANTIGATMVGGLAVSIWSESANVLLHTSLAMAVAILFFSEILPKNLGVAYRPILQPWLIFPLIWVCSVMKPVSWGVGLMIRKLLAQKDATGISEQEIVLMAERSAEEGNLTTHERDMIANALNLEDVPVRDIMTPRTVVFALEKSLTVGTLFDQESNLRFARIPLYDETMDNIIGIVRRRDLLSAKARDEDARPMSDFSMEVLFIPDNASAADALKTFLKAHQQLAVTVDEFGSPSGVVTLEDVVEQIIGAEIFEHDDPAVDMREFARRTLSARGVKNPPS
jgi:CBS domain containing-hemolysin-like protein